MLQIPSTLSMAQLPLANPPISAFGLKDPKSQTAKMKAHPMLVEKKFQCFFYNQHSDIR